jgi:hypothetical protein
MNKPKYKIVYKKPHGGYKYAWYFIYEHKFLWYWKELNFYTHLQDAESFLIKYIKNKKDIDNLDNKIFLSLDKDGNKLN